MSKECCVSKEQLKDSNIPAKMFRLQYETFPWRNKLKPNNALVKFSSRFTQDPTSLEGLGIFLFGEKGSGRSFLACRVAMQILAAGFKVRYYTYDQLVNFCLSNQDGPSFEGLILEPNLLVVDNINQSDVRGQGYYRVLQRILQSRSDWDLSSILVTSLNPAAFEEVFGKDCANLVRRHFVDFPSPGSQLDTELRQAKRNIQFLEQEL